MVPALAQVHDQVEVDHPPAAQRQGGALRLDARAVGGEKAPRGEKGGGEPHLTLAERVYGANTFNVLAFSTGTPGRPVNAIPPKAVANCQLRFIAGTKVEDIGP